MKTCKKCQQKFQVTEKDKEFYKKVSPMIAGKMYLIPEPTECPDCRQTRRLAWRNERNLYQRSCDLCQKKVLSIYKKENSFPVYCNECWWSDKWDAKEHGREYDFGKPFFEQFKELQSAVPRMAVLQSQNENSEYTSNVSHLKNCYLLFSADFNRDCYYGVWVENCQDCLDNLIVNKCRFTHEAIFSDNINNSTFLIHCSQCNDSAFLMDCNNCSNCCMCYGLRNKEYYIANKKYSKEDYFKEIGKLPLSSYKNYEKLKKHFFEIIKDAPCLYMWRNGRVEDSTGDFLTDVKDCEECFEITEGRDCKYVQGAYKITDAFDCSYVHGELGYENCECFFMPVRSSFNLNCYYGNDVQYCDMCMNNNKYIFGCVSLKKSEYCILNKQYTPEEYEELVPRIIEHMGEDYGEFFPMELSYFDYEETNAQDFFPLKKDGNKKQTSPSDRIPDDINDVSKKIIDEILCCESCAKNYKIILQQYNLLKKLQLPIPRKCFECRHKERSLFRKKRKLHTRKCNKCQAEIQTTYPEKSPQKVYCEKCYLEQVY